MGLGTLLDDKARKSDMVADEDALDGAERELPRQPGMRENRWVHLLSGPPDVAARKTAVHQGRLTVVDGVLVFERDVPAGMALLQSVTSARPWGTT